MKLKAFLWLIVYLAIMVWGKICLLIPLRNYAKGLFIKMTEQ